MSKIIAQIWNGNLEPLRYFGTNNSEIKQLEIFIQRNFEKLEETLDESEKKTLEKYNNSINEYIAVTSEQAFCDGFSLGIRIAAEAFTETDHQQC